jgi:Metal binding domain of Ada
MVGTRLQSCNDLTLLTDDMRWAAVVEKNSRFDGSFVYSVATTGVYCRPSCPSRPAKRTNVPPPYPPPQAGEGREGVRASGSRRVPAM